MPGVNSTLWPNASECSQSTLAKYLSCSNFNRREVAKKPQAEYSCLTLELSPVMVGFTSNPYHCWFATTLEQTPDPADVFFHKQTSWLGIFVIAILTIARFTSFREVTNLNFLPMSLMIFSRPNSSVSYCWFMIERQILPFHTNISKVLHWRHTKQYGLSSVLLLDSRVTNRQTSHVFPKQLSLGSIINIPLQMYPASTL